MQKRWLHACQSGAGHQAGPGQGIDKRGRTAGTWLGLALGRGAQVEEVLSDLHFPLRAELGTCVGPGHDAVGPDLMAQRKKGNEAGSEHLVKMFESRIRGTA